MFNLEDEDGSVRKRRGHNPVPGDKPGAAKRAKKKNDLDSEASHHTFQRLMDLYLREMDRQFTNRQEMAIDEDFYDNLQWDEDDAALLKERGQVPIVYNVIASSVNWVLGTEKRGRADARALPRRKEEGRQAERKTQLLKYLSDANTTPYQVSRAFEDGVKVGLGWVEDGWDPDEDEPIYCRYESWRNVIYDSAAVQPDLRDARYIFRTKWLDLDIAEAIFPERAELLRESAEEGEDGYTFDSFGDEFMDSAEEEMQGNTSTRSDRMLGYKRRRVRIIEAWYRMPCDCNVLDAGPFKNEVYDAWSPGHVNAYESGEAGIKAKRLLRMHVCLFTPSGLLWKSESPYRHNRYPLTPVWGNRFGRDGLPYGMIRGLRDIQADINKRASKALYILSSNKIIMDEGAVDDLDELAEEAARPDGIIVKKSGKELKFDVDRELSQYQLELFSRNVSMIQQVGGVTDENLGRQTNATSGRAIERRQSQGSMTTAHFFDNLRFAVQFSGEKKLSLIEQFMTERKAFRITNMRGVPQYIEVNDGLPENDIVRTKADYVITDADWRASVRQAQAEELLEMMKTLPPEVSLVMLDLVVDSMDLPNREEIAKRVRALTGQRDPDQEEPTPEEIAREQKAAAMEELTLKERLLNIEKLIAEVLEIRKKADKAEAGATKENIQALGGPKRGAIDIATSLAMAPGIAPMGDAIMRESWFVPRTERERPAAPQPPPDATLPPPDAGTA